MLEIRELYFWQYTMLPQIWHSPLSDYFMKMVSAGQGQAVLLWADGVPVSYAVALREGAGWRMVYLFTLPEHRRKGYARWLIRQLVQQLEGYLRVHIVQSQPCYEALLNCLHSLGFVVNDTSCVYSVSVDQVFWARMDELKLVRIKEFVLRGGLVCVPLQECRAEIRQQLMDSTTSGFQNRLDPASLLRNPEAHVDEALSTVLVKENELLAYTLVLRPSAGVAQIEHIAEAKAEIGGGKIVAPLCATLEAMRAAPQIREMKLTISDRNQRSYQFVMEILKGVPIRSEHNVSLVATAEMLKE